MTHQRDPGELLPLTPAVFQILLSLMTRVMHGFGLIEDIEERTAGQVSLGPATMYRSLESMEREGLIEETEQPADRPGSRKRRSFYYRITDFGRAVAKAETLRLANQVNQAATQVFASDQPPGEQIKQFKPTSSDEARWPGLLLVMVSQDP